MNIAVYLFVIFELVFAQKMDVFFSKHFTYKIILY